ncbi:MAG: fasciclin domain-containing protein [Pseudomonadota bacterium]
MANLLETASSNADFTILAAAVGFVDSELSSGLATALSNPSADLTVFAPTDAAFTQLALDLGFAGDTADEPAIINFLVATLDTELLRDVILYHVSAGAKLLADFTDGEAVDTLLTDATFTPEGLTLADGEPDLLNPTLVDTDIVVDNGIIHAIDRVLIPADLDVFTADSITDIVAASGTFDTVSSDFDILLNAVIAADLAGVLASDAVDLTVFAPTDAAFIALAEAVGFDGSGEEEAFAYIVEALTLLGSGDPVPLLTDVLTYHVLPDSLQSAQVLASETLETFLGAELTVDGASLEDLEPDLPNANLTALDIQASNGIVHVIDGVLLPADLLASDGSDDVDFVIGDDTRERIVTGDDDDFIDGNGAGDIIVAGKGDDTVLGGRGRDAIFGKDGADILLGGGGRDLISGGNNRDLINGGANRDALSGGKGADTFVFEEGGARDVITDFSRIDMIDVSDFGITSFEELSGNINQLAARTNISFGDDKIILLGFDAEDLRAENFIFAEGDMIA